MTQFAAWVSGKNVPFQRHRYSIATDMQEGVVDAGDYKAAQRAAGANMSVDVAIGKAWVGIDTGLRNGLGFAFSDAIDNPAVTASHATLPRLDQVVLQWNDSALAVGVGGDIPTVRVIAGTPTAAATLDNRNGAAALPADCIRLADVLVPAASTSVTTANIRDRRPWARGFYRRLTVTSGDIAISGLGNISASMVPRVECSGVPVRAALKARANHNPSAAGQTFISRLWIDSAQPADAVDFVFTSQQAAVASEFALMANWTTVPAAPNGGAGQSSAASGSHLISPAAQMVAGTGSTVRATAANPLVFELEEIVRQNADNT